MAKSKNGSQHNWPQINKTPRPMTELESMICDRLDSLILAANKASDDIAIYGSGAVFIANDGTALHVPLSDIGGDHGCP